MPETFACLESLFAPGAGIRSLVGVRSLVRAHSSRVLEAFIAEATFLVQLSRMLEEHVFLQMVSLLEADAADFADERSFVGMSPDVVLIVGVLRKRLLTNLASPLRHGSWAGRLRPSDRKVCSATPAAPAAS